jgi:hypothetical protein
LIAGNRQPKEKIMLDLAAGVESKNYDLSKTMDPQILRECLWLILPLAAIAIVLSFQIWIRSQVIHIGYQSQDLRKQEEVLKRNRQQLIVKKQALQNPKWLEAMASNKLGMTILKPDQIISVPVEKWDTTVVKTSSLENPMQHSEIRKTASFN